MVQAQQAQRQMERAIDSLQECRFPEGLGGCNQKQVVQTLLETSQIQHLESPLPPIKCKIPIGSVPPIDDANQEKPSPQSPSRQKKTQKRSDNKNTSQSETKARDMPLKRHSRKASRTRLPISPVTTKCISTTSPSSVASLITTATITALSTIASHLVPPMDTINTGPPRKEEKFKEGNRKRAKKSRSSQRTLVPRPLEDKSMSGNPEPPVAISNESDCNDPLISQSTTIASQRRPAISSTNARVQAAKEFLNVSRHDFHRDQDRVSSDKGRENKRATKKKLANLSLERESLHHAKPRRTRSSCSNKPISPKKTKGCRQSKIRPTQISPHDNIDDGQQHQGTDSMPNPNPTVTRPVQSIDRTDIAECTSTDVSRHERRIAARNELEAISTHIRHRSHSRSLRTSESAIRRQVDRVTSLSHAASSHAQSSTSEEDITSTLIVATGKSSTDADPAYQVSCMLSLSEKPCCLASKSEPSQPTEHGEHRLVGSIEIDDEVHSFACSLDSHMSQNTPKELLLQSIQDDALQIIRMLPPKLGSKNQMEEKPTLDIPNSHSKQAPPSNQSTIVSTDMLQQVPPKTDPLTRPSGGLSSSLHPKTDLLSFLKHVAVLNDLKALTDLSSASDSAELGQSELMNRTTSPSKFRRFQRFFQLKCTLFNILRQEPTDDETDRLRQTLLQHYDIEGTDLDFVLEHLALCEQENIDIRWDLVRMIFFPEDEDPCHHNSHNYPESRIGHHSLPILGHSSSILVASDEKRLWHSNVEFPTWNSLSDSLYMERSHDSSDRCDRDDKTVDEHSMCLSPMEEFQEEILDLFESVESSMADLPFEQQKERRLVLVELLQATSEEEAHMTTLSFDDMAEIVRHVRVCRKTNTDVQWDMIRDIVFPFGVNSLDSLLKRADGEGSRDCGHESSLGNSSILHQSFRSVERFDDGMLSVLDYCDHPIDIAGKLSDMTGEDLEVVLQHIQVSIGNGGPIRWNLIGDILYPGDPERQSIFSSDIGAVK